MKRFLVLVFLCFPLSVSAANKMSMVTYFPVPYVAYSRINVSDQLDAGLTSACNMNLGCNESSVNLQVNTLNVKQYSKLDLNGGKGVWSNSMTLGSGSDNGRIAFNKVRIQGGTSRSINVKGTMNVPSLKLFESDFPDCKQAGGKDGTMSWKSLKLKGAAGSELYLACGEAGTVSKPACPQPPAPIQYKSCEDVYGRTGLGPQEDYTGNVKFVWDEETCDWKFDSSTCEKSSCEWVASSRNWPFYTSQKVVCDDYYRVTEGDIQPGFSNASAYTVMYTQSGVCSERPLNSHYLCVNLNSGKKTNKYTVNCPMPGSGTPSLGTTVQPGYTVSFDQVYEARCTTSRI